MSNGDHGMLRGQMPNTGASFDPSTLPKRSSHDTEHERMAVKPQKTHAASTGFTSKIGGIAADGVMEQAMQYKLSQTMNEAIQDGYEARLEDEANKEKQVTSAMLDAKQDSANCDDDDLEMLRARRRQQMKDAHEKKIEVSRARPRRVHRNRGRGIPQNRDCFGAVHCAFLSQELRKVQDYGHAHG